MTNKININISSKIKIPTPRFFVFYNGKTDKDDFFKMRLSESFLTPDNSGDFEWTATVININEDRLTGIHKNCKSLYDYAKFIAKVRECVKGKAPKYEDVETAVDWAIEEDLLEGFFERQKAEVIGMILAEFNQETYEKCAHDYAYRDGREDKAVEDAVMIVKEFNAEPKAAAEKTGAPLDKVLEALATQPAPAQAQQ